MLNKEEILDVIVTALEGGSNYWYLLKDDSIQAIREKVSQEENSYLSEAFAQAIDKGAEIPVYDAEEEDEILGTVTKKSIREGIKKCNADRGKDSEVWDVKRGDYDAGDADVLFQYFVMGEIVF